MPMTQHDEPEVTTMTRQRLILHEGDVGVLARALGTDADTLRGDLDRRPWYANDVLRRPAVIEAILHGSELDQIAVSPLLFFAVVVHAAADELSSHAWVDDWVGPGCRLPVFDVEPLLEFADAPERLLFTAHLLVDFAVPASPPVPVDWMDLDDVVDWLSAVQPDDHRVLLRHLGDLALFRAGVFPDSTGASALSSAQAEHLGRSIGMSDDELGRLVDVGSSTPGFDALELLSSAWYCAAAESSPTVPAMLRDVAHRIRAARRFLNYLADRYLFQFNPGWALGS
jgi:hypothetical protein